jgi:hypothetical protein
MRFPRTDLKRRLFAHGRLALGLLALAVGSAWPAGARAEEVRILVQRSPLAGFRYHEAPRLFDALTPGQPLDLVREPQNAHDPNAVRVEWRGHKLGYVPRTQNAALAWAMDRGETLDARIVQRAAHPNPRRRVEFEVFVK